LDTGDQLPRLLRATAYSGGGQRIGPVAAVYVDETDRPAWVSILVDSSEVERLAPLARSWLYPGRRLVVAVIRRAVEGAPVAPTGDPCPTTTPTQRSLRVTTLRSTSASAPL
jgi:hypothetical protein